MNGAGSAQAKTTDAEADFRHIDAWIFDLDHTLYTMDAGQQAEMEERICRYVQRHFGLARDAAWEIQKGYLRDYGSTLAGLVQNERIDPDTYHDIVNDVEVLGLTADTRLRAGLARLPGRRFVFTNNCGRFARSVLARLGVADLFDGICDARAMNYIPKPSPAAYEALIAGHGIAPGRAALFDDSPRNLVPARALGMKTVWFNDGLGQSHWRIERPELHIDHETNDLAAFLQAIRI
ncbi:MAG TPA: pyrimidine 5'-nucleotidase [Rhizomicrobium sp.]|jgi:putative hydrolase of the HAD superfamily|nr:pyrimidine 5'-nucleotidase [Rhizomicrobium sp.]